MLIVGCLPDTVPHADPGQQALSHHVQPSQELVATGELVCRHRHHQRQLLRHRDSSTAACQRHLHPSQPHLEPHREILLGSHRPVPERLFHVARQVQAGGQRVDPLQSRLQIQPPHGLLFHVPRCKPFPAHPTSCQ